MYCDKCGAEITGSEKFCGSCGAPVAMRPAGRVDYESKSAATPQTPTISKKEGRNLDVKWIIGLAASIVQVLCITVIPRYTFLGVSYTALTSLRLVIVIPFLILSALNVAFFLLKMYKGVLICNIFCVLYAIIEVGFIYLYSETVATLGPAMFLYPIATIAVFIGRSGHKKAPVQ